MSMKRVAGIATFVVGISAAAAIMAGHVGAAPVDPRLEDCGLSTPGNAVLAAFDLDQASRFWEHFPSAAGAPELQNASPAFVAVFKNPYTWFRTGETFQNVVCVYQDGQPHIYPDVNLSGANMQP